jgi:RHS repeat-associated protein
VRTRRPRSQHRDGKLKYDPFGRRIYKSSSSGTSVYAYDGDNLVEETKAAGAVVARYEQGLNIDEPLAMRRSATTSYYQSDGLGSVTSLSNSTGAAAQTYTYDSFGKIVATTGSLTNSFRYTGREFDSETSLYYYRARYYDPQGGRFVSEDPLGFGGGINFYRFVNNDATNSIDPSGRNTTVIIIYDQGPFGSNFGSHAAFLIDNGGQPILYDPAGSYGEDHLCGPGAQCVEGSASIKKYLDYHNKIQISTATSFLFSIQLPTRRSKLRTD